MQKNGKKGIKMNRLSVKLRVTLWYTLIMAIVSVIVMVAMTSISRQMIDRDLSMRVVRTVNDMAHRPNFPDRRMMLPVPEAGFYENGVHMAVYDSEKNIIRGNIPFEIDEAFEDDKLKLLNIDGKKFYIYDRKISVRDQTSQWIRGVVSVTDESYALKTVNRNNLMLIIVMLVVAALGGYLIISRAFVPVNKISKTAKEISESKDLSRRINIGKGKDEISSLANTFDAMLDKIETAFEKEKQFTSDASHELRTPVAVILSECEYMTECAKTEDEYKESALSIKNQTEKMSKLISELLTISRMDKNTIQTNFEETDISELLSFVCDEQEEINGDNITLVREIESDVFANADKFLIARLFINLISNAYRYSKDTGEIIVKLAKADGNVVFSVKDTGIGIAESDIPKIWERFYQADPSRSSGNDGVGLGLSMVKWIANVHNGDVTVTSELGVGSEFTFEFPIVKE